MHEAKGTPVNGFDQRWSEIKADWQASQWLYVVVGIFIGLLVQPLISIDAKELLRSLAPEAIGIGFTVFVIDRIYRRREQVRFKADLIYKMGSSVNAEAVRAAEEISRLGWLEDGSLIRARLPRANLRGADLKKAKLDRIFLIGGKLSKAVLDEASLEHANLWSIDLREAMLHMAVLKNAFLLGADLRGARLVMADLRGANLNAARLEGAVLELKAGFITLAAFFDENTLLPDDTHWTPETDMQRFTDSKHPEFWRFEEHVVNSSK